MSVHLQFHWIFEKIVADAKLHDIFTSIANHYGHDGGLDGLEAELVINYVIDSVLNLLESQGSEQLKEIALALKDTDEIEKDGYSTEELAVRLEKLFSVWMNDQYDLYGNISDGAANSGWDLCPIDKEAIDFALEAAYALLRKPGVRPYDIQGIARAIFALESLPLFDRDINVTFGIIKKAGDNTFSESFSIDFEINLDHFKIYESWSTYEAAFGSNNTSTLIYFYGPDYKREVDDLPYFRNKFYSFLNSSEVCVVDDSDPDVSLEEEE